MGLVFRTPSIENVKCCPIAVFCIHLSCTLILVPKGGILMTVLCPAVGVLTTNFRKCQNSPGLPAPPVRRKTLIGA